MAAKLRTVLIALAVGLILGGLVGEYGPAVWRLLPVAKQQIEQAAIVRETGIDKPLSKELVALYAQAPGVGVWVIDDDTLGPGKQPSAKLKPFLDAAAGKELPVLVLLYAGGDTAVEPLPATIDELKRRVGK